MTSALLRDLLNRMTVEEVVANSDQSVAWHAHREAERLADEKIIDEIGCLIGASKSKAERSAAYFILGCIGSNTGAVQAAGLLMERTTIERDKYVLSHLLGGIAKLSLPSDLSLEPIYQLLNDTRWLVRHTAISSLGGASSPEAEERILELLARTADPHDQIYSHVTLGRIGTPRAIPFVNIGLKSRKRDVKQSAEAAIKAIKARHGMAE
jgi:HEAT repeat protein